MGKTYIVQIYKSTIFLSQRGFCLISMKLFDGLMTFNITKRPLTVRVNLSVDDEDRQCVTDGDMSRPHKTFVAS
jgi:hypothetical protein